MAQPEDNLRREEHLDLPPLAKPASFDYVKGKAERDFNAAARADPQSVKSQTDRQEGESQEAVREPNNVQLGVKPASFDKRSGDALTAFTAADANQPQEKSVSEGVGPQQVQEDQPKPQTRPTSEMAATGDRQKHNKEKSADADASAKANRLAEIAAQLKANQTVDNSAEQTKQQDHSREKRLQEIAAKVRENQKNRGRGNEPGLSH